MSTEYVEAAHRLADILAQENQALKQLDFAAAVALVGVKDAALAELAKPPAGAALSPSLAGLARHLDALAAENRSLLERAIAVQTRIVRIIARSGVSSQPAEARHDGYGSRRLSNRATGLALSQRA